MTTMPAATDAADRARPRSSARLRRPAAAAAAAGRLETRFVDDTATASASCWVRSTRTDQRSSSFEPELTAGRDRRRAGLLGPGLAGGRPAADQDAVQAPWRGAGRRAISRAAGGLDRAQLTPTNLAQQPAAPTPAGQTPSPAPLPGAADRASSYEQAPDRAGAARRLDGRAAPRAGHPRRSPAADHAGLAVGLTPHDGTLPDGLPVDAGMRWLVDFDAAVRPGWACGSRSPPTSGPAASTASSSRRARRDGRRPGDAALAALLDAHHYTDGLALRAAGRADQ